MIRRQYTARIGTNLETSADMIEMALRMAQSTAFSAFGDSAMAESFRPRELLTPEFLAGRWRIPRVLQRTELAVGEYADRLFAYFDVKEIWSSGGRTDFDFFLNRVYHYDRYEPDFFRSHLFSGKTFSVLSATDVTGLDTSAGDRVVPLLIRGKIEDKSAVLILNISVAALARTLKGGAIFPTTSFLILSPDGANILEDDAALGSWKPDLTTLVPEEDTTVLVSGVPYLLSCRVPGFSGWTYVAMTKMDSVAAIERGILRTILIICAILAAMSLGFAFFFSSVIYNPIRAIRDLVASIDQLGAGTKNAPVEGDDFDAIRRGLDHLKRDGEVTKVRADEWTREYVESAFRFILRGHRLGREAILREALESEYGFRGVGYACAIVRFGFSKEWFETRQDTERLRISDGLKDLLRGMIAASIPCVSFEYRQDCLAIVADLAGPRDVSRLSGIFDMAIRSLEYDGGNYSISVGIGGYKARIDDIGESWGEAMTVSSGAGGTQRFLIVSYAPCDGSEKPRRATFTPLDEQELLNALKEGAPERISVLVDSFFETNLKAGASWPALLELRDDLLACGRRFSVEKGLDIAASRATNAEPNPESDVFCVDELRKDAAARLTRISLEAPNSSGSGRDGLVLAIERYIESHYDAGLCLERIADEMGVSAKYVSRVFREERGEKLTDRVDRIRMARAKDLILAGGKGISEISRSVGIESRATFLRVFRRTEGMSPSEYRERYAKAAP
ncbi:MAG TPA: AraC family transcriptional regulator [Rectinemataceae bacterium]|nr:AraC family transcriptional regulator [Rectinemataceae bacterium]